MRRVLVLLLSGVVVLAPTLAAAEDGPAAADVARSLPSVTSGARPGPDVLYSPAPAAPQLAHDDDARFAAPPLLVSGTEAYVDGEYLYQDHLFDDYGADTNGSTDSSLSANAGDITYPTDTARYGGNAADLVEFRISPGTDDVRYRVTLNTLLVADSTIIALAFDTDGDATTGSSTLPGDPGAPFPGTDEAIVTWGTGAQHHALSGAAPVTTDVTTTVDLDANRITVTVPRSVSDPTGTWTTTLAVGLHDGTGGWLLPAPVSDETTLGGANGITPTSGILNLGFRFDEPYVVDNTPPDLRQAEALRAGEPTTFAHELDFAALAAGTDSSTVPTTGPMVRLFPSRLDLPEGRDVDTFPAYLGQLQPYSLYVPTTYTTADPAPFTLALHSLGQEHWQYNGSVGIQQLGEERGSIVATPLGRGPDGWYQREAEVDVFEVWNDVARHFALDPDRSAITGYSMGGYGTYRLGGLFPDLFGAAGTIVGPPGDGIWLPPAPPTGGAATLSNLWLENVRNLPFINLVAAEDQLVPVVGPRAQNIGAPEQGIDGFEQLGYRHRFQLFPTAEHFTIALLGYDTPQFAAFLGEARVDRDPSHVTFSYLLSTDEPELGLVHDHAYWVSSLELADTSAELAEGTVDAFSHGFGEGAPTTVAVQGGGVGPLPYVESGLDWEPRPEIPVDNLLELRLTNVAAVELDVARAALDPTRELTLEVEADADGTLVLSDAFPADTEVLRDGTTVNDAEVGASAVRVPVVSGAQTIVLRSASAGGTGGGGTTGEAGAPAAGDLAATGGGGASALLALLAVGAAATLHRRREA